MLGFATHTKETFVFGDSFLINYYSVFDDTKNLLTLAPVIDGPFENIDMGAIPPRYFSIWDNPNLNSPIFTVMAIIAFGAATWAILTKMGIVQMLMDKWAAKRAAHEA